MRPFCAMRICFGPAIPAAELRIEDPKHKVSALRKMKGRLKTELDGLLVAHAFEGTALPAPEEKPARPARKPAPAPEEPPALTLEAEVPASPALDAAAEPAPEQKETL